MTVKEAVAMCDWLFNVQSNNYWCFGTGNKIVMESINNLFKSLYCGKVVIE